MKVAAMRQVDVLIITALDEEYKTIRSHLPSIDETYSSDNMLPFSFSQVTNGILSYSIATTCIFDMGNANAGVLAAGAIRELSPTYIIMFGLAGGIRGRVRLGDVIVPTQIYYYELGKLRSDALEERPDMLPPDPTLESRMHSYALNLETNYDVKFGPFAVGEKVISDVAAIEKFKKYVPKLVGIEMESYGVAVAALYSTLRPQFIAVRGVSDFADKRKSDKSREKCLNNAADFLIGFLRSGALPQKQHTRVDANRPKSLIAIHHLSMERRTSIRNAVDTSLVDYRNHHIEELLIDQTDLFQNGSVASPKTAFERQKGLISRLDELLHRYPDAEIGYFGLAHIPFIFHAGYEINRREVRTFGTDRQTGEWQPPIRTIAGWSKIVVEGLPSTSSEFQGDVILRVSISSAVLVEQVQGLVPSPIASIHVSVEDPHLDYVTNEDQLNEYAFVFRQVLTDVHRLFPNAQSIYLFFAGPPGLAFRCGQQISKTSDPDVIVFNFSRKDRPNYRWGLNLCTGEILDMASLG